MGDVERTDAANGTGDVIFARTFSRTSNGGTTSSPLGFFGIANPRDVEKLIHDLKGAGQ
jgi:hypothetical protein